MKRSNKKFQKKEKFKFFKQTELISEIRGKIFKKMPIINKNAPTIDYKNISF